MRWLMLLITLAAYNLYLVLHFSCSLICSFYPGNAMFTDFRCSVTTRYHNIISMLGMFIDNNPNATGIVGQVIVCVKAPGALSI